MALAAEVGEHGAVELEPVEEVGLELAGRAPSLFRGRLLDGAGLHIGGAKVKETHKVGSLHLQDHPD